MTGQRARAVDVVPSDVSWIAHVIDHWQFTDRWSSLYARTPSPHTMTQLLREGVVYQEALVRGDEHIGLFQVSDADFRHGHANLNLLVDPHHSQSLDDLLERFVDRAFREFSLRKLCVAAAAGDLVFPRPLASKVRTVGTLREHRRRLADSFVDVHLYEMWATG